MDFLFSIFLINKGMEFFPLFPIDFKFKKIYKKLEQKKIKRNIVGQCAMCLQYSEIFEVTLDYVPVDFVCIKHMDNIGLTLFNFA